MNVSFTRGRSVALLGGAEAVQRRLLSFHVFPFRGSVFPVYFSGAKRALNVGSKADSFSERLKCEVINNV